MTRSKSATILIAVPSEQRKLYERAAQLSDITLENWARDRLLRAARGHVHIVIVMDHSKKDGRFRVRFTPGYDSIVRAAAGDNLSEWIRSVLYQAAMEELGLQDDLS